MEDRNVSLRPEPLRSHNQSRPAQTPSATNASRSHPSSGETPDYFHESSDSEFLSLATSKQSSSSRASPIASGRKEMSVSTSPLYFMPEESVTLPYQGSAKKEDSLYVRTNIQPSITPAITAPKVKRVAEAAVQSSESPCPVMFCSEVENKHIDLVTVSSKAPVSALSKSNQKESTPAIEIAPKEVETPNLELSSFEEVVETSPKVVVGSRRRIPNAAPSLVTMQGQSSSSSTPVAKAVTSRPPLSESRKVDARVKRTEVDPSHDGSLSDVPSSASRLKSKKPNREGASIVLSKQGNLSSSEQEGEKDNPVGSVESDPPQRASKRRAVARVAALVTKPARRASSKLKETVRGDSNDTAVGSARALLAATLSQSPILAVVPSKDWKREEVVALYTCHSKVDVRRADFWSAISDLMQQKGFQRTATECEAKWFKQVVENEQRRKTKAENDKLKRIEHVQAKFNKVIEQRDAFQNKGKDGDKAKESVPAKRKADEIEDVNDESDQREEKPVKRSRLTKNDVQVLVKTASHATKEDDIFDKYHSKPRIALPTSPSALAVPRTPSDDSSPSNNDVLPRGTKEMTNFFHSNKVHQIKRIQPVLLASYDKATTNDKLAIGAQGIGTGVLRNQLGSSLHSVRQAVKGSVRQQTSQMMELHDDVEEDDDDSEYEDDESRDNSVDL
eukprot:scaffold3051_cov167-Ochromonas_danica.AAC.11